MAYDYGMNGLGMDQPSSETSEQEFASLKKQPGLTAWGAKIPPMLRPGKQENPTEPTLGNLNALLGAYTFYIITAIGIAMILTCLCAYWVHCISCGEGMAVQLVGCYSSCRQRRHERTTGSSRRNSSAVYLLPSDCRCLLAPFRLLGRLLCSCCRRTHDPESGRSPPGADFPRTDGERIEMDSLLGRNQPPASSAAGGNSGKTGGQETPPNEQEAQDPGEEKSQSSLDDQPKKLSGPFGPKFDTVSFQDTQEQQKTSAGINHYSSCTSLQT